MSTWIYEQTEKTPEWGPEGVPASVMGILQRRGIRTAEEAEDFLAPAPKRTYDPELLPDLPAAADKLLQAAADGSFSTVSAASASETTSFFHVILYSG